MGVIYKITNLINNKIYIGQTLVTEPQRWQNHIWHAYNNPDNDCVYLCNAIKKYGRENFKREILEEVNDSNELNKKEIYYIKLYNSTNPDIGYNISMGGGGHSKYDSIEILELYERFGSVIKVAKYLNASTDTISRRLKGMGVDTYNNTVLQISLDGNLINTYESFNAAKRATGLPLPIRLPKNYFSCGYLWAYEKDISSIESVIESYKQNNYLQKPIQQYDLNCQFIGEYNSAAEAARKLNINVSSIKSVLNGRQFSAGGYIWHKQNSNFSLEEQYRNYLLSASCCQIEEIDLDGNIIKTYKSATSAEKELGWSYNSIKRVCDGKATHTHGRIFRYSNKDKRFLIGEKNGG